MKVRWCRRGLRSLNEIAQFLGEDDPAAARNALAQVRECLGTLETSPQSGHVSRREGVLELSVGDSPYQMLYRIAEDAQEVHVLEIFHVARRKPQHW